MSRNVNLQTFFDGAPSADEIDYHISNDPVFWNTATPSEAIDEIKYIRDTYYEAGHNNYDMLHPDLDDPNMAELKSTARQEIKEIKALIRYLENKLAEDK
jgi:hypothetical protein